MKCDDGNEGLRATQNENFARVHNAAPVTRIEASFTLSKSHTCLTKRTQFSVILSWAYTIPKTLGLTLDKVCVSFTLSKQKSFGNGQIYVAFKEN